LLDVTFPGSPKTKWRFAWSVTEIPVGVPTDILGLSVTSAEVLHYSGAPSTALRLTDGSRTLAYSGDTEWTETLPPIASGADLFIVECFDYARDLSGHLNWTTVRQRLPDFSARRVMVTHMNPTMLARLEEARAAGLLVAEDGLIVDL
jgi:ribonuclease BN (tRNA processing enzyme)